jgi:tetratricopeptide (TPR) repeat protein
MEINTMTSRTRSLFEFYVHVDGTSFKNPEKGRDLIREFIPERHQYTGPADIWYNLTAEAGRLSMPEAGLLITETGLQEHPDSVDLLCDQLSDYYGLFRNVDKAKEIWERLNSLETSKRYWRYWVFGAAYHARILLDREAALVLLEKGLLYVSSDQINNIVRGYRRILIDAPPSKISKDREEREKQEIEAFERMESLYKWAISLGIEEGHSIAVQLATLYQERAGYESSNEFREDYLNQALKYLDYAEKMYIRRGQNNEIWNIYIPKARIFMGQHRYTDALKIFRILPESILDKDPSALVQMRLAAEIIGIPLDDMKSKQGKASSGSVVSVLDLLKKDPGSFFSELASIAQENEEVFNVLGAIVERTKSS